MNRFRAYSHGTMYTQDNGYFTFGVNGYWSLCEYITNEFIAESVDEETYLMQSLGVEDKNGQQIFVGDIVKFVLHNHVISEPGIFSLGQYGHGDYGESMYYGTKIGDFYGSPTLKDVEVVGNVYENPELIDIHDTINREKYL